jgi:hypothetical protein
VPAVALGINTQFGKWVFMSLHRLPAWVTFALNLLPKMKKLTLWSIVLIALSTGACRKTEMVNPENAGATSYAKTSRGSTATATSYSGRGTGVNATIWNTSGLVVTSFQSILAQTRSLPMSGGVLDTSLAPASISGVLTADSLYAFTSGQNGTSTSQAFASNLSVTIGGHTIAATSLRAIASSVCGGVRTGSSSFSGLVINGNAITVTGAANQAIYLSNGGMIIINEQSSSKKGGPITVSALHIIIPNVTDMRIGTAVADIQC